MMTVALIMGGLVVMGLAFGLVAIVTAPVGYQDEKGFHFGPKETSQAEATFAFGMAEHRTA